MRDRTSLAVTAIIIRMSTIRTGRHLAAATHDLAAIGRRLQAARRAAGLQLGEAAAQAGLAHNTLSQWENGTRRPSLDQLVLLIPLLRLTLDFIYLGDDRGLDWQTREAVARELAAMTPDDDTPRLTAANGD